MGLTTGDQSPAGVSATIAHTNLAGELRHADVAFTYALSE